MSGRTLISNPRGSGGFTLIEILVVVVILAVLAGAATLAVGGVGGERQLARQAEQVRTLFGYACEQAELSGRDLGITLDTRGYRFSIASRGEWIATQASELRPRQWLVGTAPKLTRDDQLIAIVEKTPDKPQLVCFSSGELTPFRLELALADLNRRYRIDGQPDGDVKVSTVESRVR
jgi:general secretion pathway protein H